MKLRTLVDEPMDRWNMDDVDHDRKVAHALMLALAEMGAPFIEWFWCFVCRIFGHRFCPNAGWIYAGKLHCVCNRCSRIISEPADRRTPEKAE